MFAKEVWGDWGQEEGCEQIDPSYLRRWLVQLGSGDCLEGNLEEVRCLGLKNWELVVEERRVLPWVNGRWSGLREDPVEELDGELVEEIEVWVVLVHLWLQGVVL